MMDLQDRLRAHMERQMAATRQSNLGEVMDRGEVIRRRRRLASATLPAAAALVIVVGVMFHDRLQPNDADIEGVEAVAASNARLSVHQGSLDWAARPATLGFFQQQSISSDGVLYVLSTAPGARFEDFPNGDIPKAIYASTDGVDWSGHLVGGSWVTSIGVAEGLLYAVGTAPGAEADSVALRIDVSDDHGASFLQSSVLPVRGRPDLVNPRVVATPGGVLAAATSRTSVDPISLLPPEVLEGPVEALMVEQPVGGIAVLPYEAAEEAYEVCFGGDPERCGELIDTEAVHFSTWEDLGLDGEEMTFGEVVTHTAYWSEDGHNFEEVEYPFPEGYLDGVYRLGDRAVVSMGGPAGSQLFVSDNARSWRQLDVPSVGWVHALGELDGRLVVVAQTQNDETVIFHAPDLSGPWEEIALRDLVDLPDGEDAFVWASAATVGDGGVALNLSVEQRTGGDNPITALLDRFSDRPAEAVDRAAPDTVGIMLLSRDLTTWRAVPSSDLGSHVDSLLTSPDGRLIAHASVADQDGRPVRQQYTAQP